MRTLPPKLLRAYQEQLNTSNVDRKQHVYYLKWFRYYYDFWQEAESDFLSPK